MIYLDNAATTMPKPRGVYECVLNTMEQCASLGRSGHGPALRASETVFRCRRLAASMFDCTPEQVVFTMNATHGLNIAIHSIVKPGDRVVVSGFEHNAVMRPLHYLNADIHVAGTILFQPEDTLESFRRALTKDTKLVVCTHVSNVFGYILPVDAIADLCAERGIPFVLDASQSAGCLPVSLSKLHSAYIAMPGHKGLYGPQGTGILLSGQMPEPLMQGGTGSQSQSLEMPEELPDRAEAGTHNLPGIAGLLAGLEYVREKKPEEILRHEQHLLRLAQRELEKLPELTLYCGAPGTQGGVLSFDWERMDCEIAAGLLAEGGFAVRAGLHCAPLAHKSAGTLRKGTVRLSFSAFNTEEDVLALSRFLHDLQEK